KITYDERNLLAINSEHKQTIVIEIPPKGDPKMSFAKKSGIKILEDVIIKAFNQTKHKFPRPSTTKSYSYAVLWITEEPDLRYVDQDACR
ncbi:MAG: hypothetical protein LUC34_06920, partial [Campylobacter sp.]|nr:hypothetical protein [Campylobacter sp.]